MPDIAEHKVAILGAVGVPAGYGGFETLAENLVSYHAEVDTPLELTVYCSSKGITAKPARYRQAVLRYVALDANGLQSIPYDMIGLLDAVRRGHNRVLLLGVSGAILLPLLKLFTRARIITNVDGIEWKREKWRGLAKHYLWFAERVAVKASDEVVADNQAIAEYLKDAYGCDARVIPYGGDHAVETEADAAAASHLPQCYALGLCRIEPENNIAMILDAFDRLQMPLVFVGNWDRSSYGRELKAKYADHPMISIEDPVYDPAALRAIRDRAAIYIHGHSAGGTNPALVEMMHFGVPIAAYDCSFNRYTTEGRALYFSTAEELCTLILPLSDEVGRSVGEAMREIALRRYTWRKIGQAYFELLQA